jgi:hypothetical protein
MKVIVTIDTEADGQWGGTGAAAKVALENLAYVPRFQRLCDAYGMKPTYLCTYEVAQTAAFKDTLVRYEEGGRAEIGAHLHPWTTPPFAGGDGVDGFDPTEYPGYPSELPLTAFRAKLTALTELLRARTGRAPTSYRAGRWGFIAEHVPVLRDLGYIVDCSVTPHVDRSAYRGVRAGGPDFRKADVFPYELDETDACTPGKSGLLEVPVTILYTHPLMRKARARELFWRVKRFRVTSLLNRALRLEPSWFRPYPTMTARRMIALVEEAKRIGLPVVEMMFHSSELMPGGSESFPTAASIERLYRTFEDTFAHLAVDGHEGVTLSAYARSHPVRAAVTGSCTS